MFYNRRNKVFILSDFIRIPARTYRPPPLPKCFYLFSISILIIGLSFSIERHMTSVHSPKEEELFSSCLKIYDVEDLMKVSCGGFHEHLIFQIFLFIFKQKMKKKTFSKFWSIVMWDGWKLVTPFRINIYGLIVLLLCFLIAFRFHFAPQRYWYNSC